VRTVSDAGNQIDLRLGQELVPGLNGGALPWSITDPLPFFALVFDRLAETLCNSVEVVGGWIWQGAIRHALQACCTACHNVARLVDRCWTRLSKALAGTGIIAVVVQWRREVAARVHGANEARHCEVA